MYPQGGFKIQTVIQIGNVLAAYNTGRISLRAIRIYFAAVGAVATREAATRSSKRTRRKERRCRYQATELAQLCRCSLGTAKRELRSLQRAGLLLFSETEIAITTQTLPGSHALIEELAGSRSPLRPIPIPRTALRFLARCTKVATIKTMLAYCVRGLVLTRDGELKGKGTAKASWIADTLGLSLRAVRVARAELIATGFITPDEGSTQWKLNRHGAYFTISMNFGQGERASECGSAPPELENRTKSAPPYKDKKTPSGSENQKTHARESSGSWRKAVRKPRLSDVQPEDLRSVSKTLALHAQAVKTGFSAESEADRLKFLAAAVHATRVANRNAPGLFATLVRRGQWHFATLDDEERALRCLKRWEDKHRVTAAKDTQTETAPRSESRAAETRAGLSALHASPLLARFTVQTESAGQYELPASTAAMYFAGPIRYDRQ